MEQKTGTAEELLKDLKENGKVTIATGSIPLDRVLAKVRIDVDNALQQLLEQSQLPLFLFDYVVTSVLADIRKADLDVLRTQNLDAKILDMKEE